MTTLNDIKYEHQHILNIIKVLSSRYTKKEFDNQTEDEIKNKLIYWKTIEKYVLKKYKQFEINKK